MILDNGHFKLILSSCQGFRSSRSGSFRSSRRFGGFGSFSYSGSGFSSSGFGGSFRKSFGGGTSSLAQVLATRLRLSRIVNKTFMMTKQAVQRRPKCRRCQGVACPQQASCSAASNSQGVSLEEYKHKYIHRRWIWTTKLPICQNHAKRTFPISIVNYLNLIPFFTLLYVT